MTAASLVIPPMPPVPDRPLPLFRFLRAIRRNALTMWAEQAYDQPVLTRSMFGRSNLLINDPEAIRHVLVENPGNYRRSPASIRILRPITGYGLLLSDGDEWRHQRRTIAPALAPRTLPILARHIVTSTQEALVRLEAQAGAPVDLLTAMQNLALDIAGRSIFSLEMRQYGAALRAMITEYGERFAQAHLFDMVLPASVPTLRDLRRRRFQQRWMHLIEQIMQARLAAPASDTPRDLFDLLVAARDPETGEGFTREQLRDQIATMILAGHETTAVTLFWSLTMLCASSAEQQRVAEEAADVDITPGQAMDAIPRLIRTRAVINETLRLYPPAFTIVREAKAADSVAGIDIKAGAVVMIAPWVLHRHRRLWHDPDAFDPTRFLPDAEPPPRFAYLPFGAGPRVCVGAQFALTEATLALAALIRRFEVSLQDVRPVLPVAVVTTQPDHPPLFRLRPRSHKNF